MRLMYTEWRALQYQRLKWRTMMLCRFVLPAFLACIVLLAGAPSARARNLEAFDDDCLVFLSSEIVEAAILPAGVRVQAVYKGQLKVGDTIAVDGLGGYRMDGRFDQPMGDHLFLYLVGTAKPVQDNNPQKAVVYSPVPSGVKAVRDDRVYLFRQEYNPGPYVVQNHPPRPNQLAIRLQEEQQNLVKRVKYVEALQRDLQAAKNNTDLLALLHTRPRLVPEKGYRDGTDEIAAVLLKRIFDSGDLQVCWEARNHAYRYMVVNAFMSPEGAAFLWKQAEDEKLHAADRALGVSCLEEILTARLEQVPPFSFLQNMVALAGKPSTPQEVRNALLQCVVHVLMRVAPSRRVIDPAHHDALVAQLVQYYQGVVDDAERLAAEQFLLFLRPADFARFQTACGPVVMWVDSVEQLELNWLDNPRLRVHSFAVVNTPIAATIEVVAEEMATGKKYRALFNRRPVNEYPVDSECLVALPQGTTTGRFRVYPQLIRDGKVAGTGHAKEIEIKPVRN